MSIPYQTPGPERAEIDALQTPAILEFGAPWCPICQGAQAVITEALGESPVPRLMVEDGPGRALGRSFRVKLWPTLIFLKNGQEIARVVRPQDTQAIREALTQITS